MTSGKGVADLAYQLWLARGQPHGSADQDWFDAESRLRSEDDLPPAVSDDSPEAEPTDVTIERAGKTYGATYVVRRGKLHLKTHTETRTVDLAEQDPSRLARRLLDEIVSAQSAK